MPKFPLWETAVRSTAAFFVLLALARVFRRDFGRVGTSDVLAVLLLASVMRNAVAYDGSDPSLTTVVVSAVVLLVWAHVVNWLGSRIPVVRKLIYAERVILIKDGKLQHRNMRSAMITEGDLNAKLRERGIADHRTVLAAYLEGDGKVTVLERPQK